MSDQRLVMALAAENDALKAEIAELKAELEALRATTVPFWA